MAHLGLSMAAGGAPRADDAGEDDFDAFNDDTFGTDAEEWREDSHDELVAASSMLRVSDEDQRVIEQSNEFFDLHGDEDDELGGLDDDDDADVVVQDDESKVIKNGSLEAAASRLRMMPITGASSLDHDPAIMSSFQAQHANQNQNQQHISNQHKAPEVTRMSFPPQQAPPILHGHLGHLPPPPRENLGHFPPLGHHHMFPPPPSVPHPAGNLNMSRPPPPFGVQPHGGMKTLQELEREMLAQTSHQQQQQFQHHRQPHFQHHQQLPYPDSRQPYTQSRGRNEYQQGYQNFNRQGHSYEDRSFQQNQYRNYGGQHRNQYQPYRSRNPDDDKNFETFGEDFVEQNLSVGSCSGGGGGLMMPGHVHVLGILRNARERGHGEATARPWGGHGEATGRPVLDLERQRRETENPLLHEDEQTASSRDPDDEYAGLMTPRERDWIVNIQLQQLKCENPYIDDYYYTVYTQKKEAAKEAAAAEAALNDSGEDFRQLKHTEEGPQLLLKAESIDAKENYKPTQFENSLGKLQAVTVKAPRKIIDVGVVGNDPFDLAGINITQKESRNYKNTLLELERVYKTLIDVEDCEKKLCALPTNTSMRVQVEDEQRQALLRLRKGLADEAALKRFWLVRKGKVLLRRAWRLMDEPSCQLACLTLLQLLPLATRRDREDQQLAAFWPEIRKHITSLSDAAALNYMQVLNEGASGSAAPGSPAPKTGYSTFKQALSSPFGVSIVLALLNRVAMAPSRSGKQLLQMLSDAARDTNEISAPLEDIRVDKSVGEMSEPLARLLATASI